MKLRDADHRDLKLAPDVTRMTIASGLRLHKHITISPEHGVDESI